jgi:membrane protein implicated in regulation of membrane protease activity
VDRVSDVRDVRVDRLFPTVLLLTLGFAFAAPWFVIVPIAIVFFLVVWVASLLFARRTPQEAVRQTRPSQMLGPGGPDDPAA